MAFEGDAPGCTWITDAGNADLGDFSQLRVLLFVPVGWGCMEMNFLTRKKID